MRKTLFVLFSLLLVFGSIFAVSAGSPVFWRVNTRAEVETAYVAALKEGSGVMVERFVQGNAHRLLVVGGRLVAAIRGKMQTVVGDGHSTVAQLIEAQINSDPRCGEEEAFPLEPLILANEPIALLELERQGFDADSVPPAGRQVLVKRQGDLAYDETDDVHPEVARAATLAARVVGLDIAGIDMVAEDVARPLADQRGAIVEVNAGPGLLMHLKPAEGKPRPVGAAIVRHLFPAGEDGRIPIVGITGCHGTTAVARLLAELVRMSGRHVGVACRDGSFVGHRRVDRTDGAHWHAGHRLLINRAVETAIIETGARSIVAEGLAYDRCTVAVVTDIDPAAQVADHYIETPEHMATVLRTPVDVVSNDGAAVLNAADSRVLELAPLCDGEVILYADVITNSIRRAIDETNRRRSKQKAYNDEHGITPRSIVKPIEATLVTAYEADYFKVPTNLEEFEDYSPARLKDTLGQLEHRQLRIVECNTCFRFFIVKRIAFVKNFRCFT